MLTNTLKTGILISLFSGAALSLSACSTVTSGIDSVGHGVVSVGESMQRKIADVEVKQLKQDQFFLAQSFHEPVNSLDSWALRIESREVCPQGYIYLSRNARKMGNFAYSAEQCYGEMNCSYKLEWQIQCADVPEEPFSLFGKS